ncbi:MAG: MarR family transcriptional regulator [Hyphomicrobiales bacterium]|nr:winged helix-turn-helix transcriptional regulator [Hyphomicrobiales bacterium]PCJ84991.1 MAG: MarR family transcriptional regulator [Hyphomicrobiales bacterium]
MNLTQPINCLTFNLQRAARSLARELDQALKPVGLSAQQFTSLGFLSGGQSHSTTKLAELLGTDRTTVTRNMNVLRNKGLVEQAEDDDQRINAMQLTPLGEQLFQQALPLWRDAQQQVLAKLKTTDAADFIGSLRQL